MFRSKALNLAQCTLDITEQKDPIDITTWFTSLLLVHTKTAKDVACTLYQVVSDFGLPDILQLDNSTEFIRALKTLSGFEHHFISA
ncbi:hypothetical protein QOT17_004368 [Balamuthia mandrillaris]